MGIHDALNFTDKFMTRLAFAYEFNIPYSTLTDRIRRGEVALHLIDNKIQVNVAEALKSCERKQRHKKVEPLFNDLFA